MRLFLVFVFFSGLIVTGYWLKLSGPTASTSPTPNVTSPTSIADVLPNDTENTNSTVTTPEPSPTLNTNTEPPVNTAVPTNTNTAPPPVTPIPPVVTSTCGTGGACTTVEIAKHNSRNDCWVYLSPINKVYDVTEYVSSPQNHPGGNVIVPYCGKNIYGPFISGTSGGTRHGSSVLNGILDEYYLGPLQSDTQ